MEKKGLCMLKTHWSKLNISYFSWTCANHKGGKQFGLKGLCSMWSLYMKLKRWSCEINMACQRPAGLTQTPQSPAPRIRGGGERGGAELQPGPLHQWQHQSQCQTEVERVQTWKHDYCAEPPTPRTRSSTNVYSWLPSKKRQGQGVGESTHTDSHSHTL